MSPLYCMLRSFDWKSVQDVSGQPIGPICNGQAVHDLDCSKTVQQVVLKRRWLDFQSKLCNIPEERRTGGSLQWHIVIVISPGRKSAQLNEKCAEKRYLFISYLSFLNTINGRLPYFM